MRCQFNGVTRNCVTYEKTMKDLDNLGWEHHVFKLDQSHASAIIHTC